MNTIQTFRLKCLITNSQNLIHNENIGIHVDGNDVTDVPPGQRGIGYVPQDGALFPTMTVRDQIGFALKVRRRAVGEIALIVDRLADELDDEETIRELAR